MKSNARDAGPYATNMASIRVLEKAGFIREGLLCANVFKDGKVPNQELYTKIMKGIS
jgi:RimJ/RimL family protein N-acetyltransferase